MFCAVQEVWKVEIGYVVSDNDIGISLFDEIPPFHKHFGLVIKGKDFGSDNLATILHAKDIADKGFFLAVPRDNIRNLDDGVHIWLREDTFAAGAFDIERKDAEWGHLCPFPVRRMGYKVPKVDRSLDLAGRMPFTLRNHFVLSGWYLNPGHTGDLGELATLLPLSHQRAYRCVDHESQDVLNVIERENAAVRTHPELLPVGPAVLDHFAHAVDGPGIRHGYLEIRALLIPLKSVHVLLHCHLYRGNNTRVHAEGFLSLGFQVDFEIITVVLAEAYGRSDVEVMQEVGDMQEDGVSALVGISEET
jgi:hypothetical protein